MDRLVKAEVKEVNLTFTRGQKSTATFRLTNLMHTMFVAVSLSTTNPSSFSFPNPFSILPPLSTSSFTLHLSSDHPPLSSLPDTILVRSSMLPTGKAHQDDLPPSVFQARSATGFGNSYFVSALIDAGADINHRDSNGQSVVSLAVQSGNIDSVQVLIESGFVIDHSIDRFLHDAAAINRADLMKLLFLGFGHIDVNSIDSQGRTALHVAAIHGHVEVLRFLVSMGGNPDAVAYNRWTLLYCAASEGHHEAVEFLLNCSMFVKYARAARIDDVHAMKSCIAEGVNVNGKDQNGWTALHRAAFKGRIESVKTLVSNGAQIDLLDDGGYTPLRRAVEGGHMQVAIYLMAHGAKAYVVKSNGSLKGFEIVPFNLDCFKNHPSLVTTPLC
ncbi:hypothetical protein TEA_015216 [Camellia sinensis var. sinensis]|uniref:Uncharacterized protein n=1 Tax=Camellia sinensis var. sinensis TaxID=542762 RepID=A0A4S4EP68_CAMSN|nr:hypothetical protein TEA_015216 [Camellia sinensis var. sinensis]